MIMSAKIQHADSVDSVNSVNIDVVIGFTRGWGYIVD